MIDVVVEQTGAVLPDGCDRFGLKAIRADRTTMHGFVWPDPGGVAQCDPLAIDWDNDADVPSHVGDGLTVATRWPGMFDASITPEHLLLVGFGVHDVLGSPGLDSIRCRQVHVVAEVDGVGLLRRNGVDAWAPMSFLAGAHLAGACLRRTGLHESNLSGANLSGADLRGAMLWQADLRRANLTGAYLNDAKLTGADLRGADLSGANLSGATLPGADLSDAVVSSGECVPQGWHVETYRGRSFLRPGVDGRPPRLLSGRPGRGVSRPVR